MSTIFPDTNDINTLWQLVSRDGKGFTTITGFITIAGTSETDFMLMRNPSGSRVLVRLKEFLMTIGGSSANKTLFRFYRNPTITSEGTPLTVSKVLSTAPIVSKLLAYQTPTISARGSLIQLFSVDFNTVMRDQDLARYLVEGADLLITVQGSTNNLEHNLVGVWAEENI